MKGPTASGLTVKEELQGTTFSSPSGDSRLEETNLTSKFKMQGPNTRKRIMANIGPKRVGTMSWRGAKILFGLITV
jgi:hypothetical protein